MTQSAVRQNLSTSAMPSRCIWLGLMYFVLSLLATHARADDLIVSRAYFLDDSRTMSYEQVQAVTFTPAGKVMSLGFTRSVLWLRLTVNLPKRGVPLGLSVMPASLDEVTLFLPRQADLVSPAPLALSARNLWNYDWQSDTVGQQVYYLRIRSTGAMTLSAEIKTNTENLELQSRNDITVAALLGSLTSTVLGCVILYFLHREMLALFGIFCTVTTMVQILFLQGFVHRVFEQGSWLASNMFFHVMIMFNLFFCLQFLYYVLLGGHLPRWGRWLSGILTAPVLALPLVYVLFDTLFALQAAAILGIINSIVLFVLALLFLIRWSRPAGYCFLVMALSLSLFRITTSTLGLAGDASEWTYSLSVWRILAPPLAFGVLLAILEHERRIALRQTQLREQTIHQSLLVLSGRRDIQERFVTTLMHEIKTPLSTIQLATASLGRGKSLVEFDNPRLKNIRRSIDDLNTIVERYMQVDQFEQGLVNIEKTSFDVGALLHDVSQSKDNERIAVIGMQECLIYSDFQSLRVILLNLLSNALKYSPPDSAVSFKCEPAQQQGVSGIRFSVSNAVGLGGAPDATQLFTRYYRSEGARRMAGAGLGLWIAQETAKSIDAELRYNHFEDMITFDLWMPFA